MKGDFHVRFRIRDGIVILPSTITLKEPDSVNNTEEDRKEFLLGVIVFVSVHLLSKHSNLLGLQPDK